VLGDLVGRTGAAHTGLFFGMSLASIRTLGAALVVRRTLVSPSEAQLGEKPTDPVVQARWRTGYIFWYALCEPWLWSV
jgi:hypothetical protein